MKVSVVLPVYNAEHTLPEILNDISAQTRQAEEVLILDDGSTDRSLEIASDFACVSKNIKVFQTPRTGITATLNQALYRARYDLIARTDSDDRIAPDRFEKQAEAFKNPEIQICSSHVRTGRNSKEPYIDWLNKMDQNELYTERFVECTLPHPSWMIRRSLFQRIGLYRQGPFPEDYEFLLRTAARAGRQNNGIFYRCHSTWTQIRVRENSLSRTDERYSAQAFSRLRSGYFIKDLIGRGILQTRPVYLWGAGRKTRRRTELLIQAGLRLSGLIDVDPQKKGRTYYGAKVHFPEIIAATLHENPFIIVALNYPSTRQKAYEYLDSLNLKQGTDYSGFG